MPFGRDTRVVPSNTVLDRIPGLHTEKGDLGSEPPVRSNAAYRQITLALVIMIIIIIIISYTKYNPTNLCTIDFQNYFTDTISRKFAIKCRYRSHHN